LRKAEARQAWIEQCLSAEGEGGGASAADDAGAADEGAADDDGAGERFEGF
jgi:hypothetical protein